MSGFCFIDTNIYVYFNISDVTGASYVYNKQLWNNISDQLK
jgi:hypothetical protein